MDGGGHPGGGGRFWVLDPIDGTAGFLAGRGWSVALALVEDGRPVLGALGCAGQPGGNAVFCAAPGLGATRVDPAGVRTRIGVSPECRYAICESYEASHSARSAETRLADALPGRPTLRMDGQGKYACVASGEVAAYVRLSRERDRLHRIWDHAAGTAVVEGPVAP